MEIEVGEYVRTSKGIAKVTDVFITNISEITGLGIRTDKPYGNVDIIKHSKNIIDLIEVGDYVNGHLVTSIDEKTNTIYVLDGMYDYPSVYINELIKSVVTKEQFTQAEYKIKEDK